MSDIASMFEDILDDIYSEVGAAMEAAGESAVEYNIKNGDYHNVTGNLRRSNYYEVEYDGNRPTKLVIGNHADYAEEVESRGKMVITGGVLLAESMLTR